MRLAFPQTVATTMHRNVLVLCAGATAIFAGCRSVYSRLLDELASEGRPKTRAVADAETWLQALWFALLLSASGLVYSFFALMQCP